MAKRLSECYGLEIYSIKGEHVGRVEDIILNLDRGAIMSLCLKPFKQLTGDSSEIKRLLKEENISYDQVNSIGDIVLINSKPTRQIRLPSESRKLSRDDDL
ncbi:MAG: PRC-barrel domain-containing protein [Candidatus Altiarchaeota archaeon]